MRMTAQSLAIEVRDLRKVYHQRHAPDVEALKGVSMEVPRGQLFGLLGPNGAGKTTMLRILTTLLRPTSGSAAIMGNDVVREPLQVRRSMCAVMQDNAIEVFLSVRNNFRVYGKFHGLNGGDIDRQADRVAELFGLQDIMLTKGNELSGGQKRRLQVAKTFMVDKPVVFLDEATTGMDTFNKRATLEAIKHEASRGRTIVLTTHIMDEAEELCDSLAIINHGKIVASGSMNEVKSLGLRLVTVRLSFERLNSRIIGALGRLRPHKIVEEDDVVAVIVRNEKEAMKVLTAAQSMRGLRHCEVSAASLEDVFVDIVDRKGEGA